MRTPFKSTIALLLTTLFLTSCSVVPITGRKQVNLVSDSEVTATSLVQYKEFISQSKLSTNQSYTNRVRTVGTRIARAADAYLKTNKIPNNMQWEFNVVESPEINAFCMPGGKIAVYTGILTIATSDAELAAIMAHEVSHAIAHHSNERISQEMLRQLGGQLIDKTVSGRSNILKTVVNQTYGIGSQLLVTLPYGRKQEYEADKMGLVLMAMAGYNPASAKNFWQKMMLRGGSGSAEFLSTHPSDGNRIKKIEKYLPEALKYYEPKK